MQCRNVNELVKQLKSKKIVIYGAGYVAKRFYKILEDMGLACRVEHFLTTKGQEEDLYGHRVLSLPEYNNTPEILICLAVHESIYDEIMQDLKSRGYENCIWVHPFYLSLMLGEPIQYGVEIPLKYIVQASTQYYVLAVRELAIDQYYKKNNVGYSIYMKAVSYYSNQETAKNRLKKFIDLIVDWDKNGYNAANKVAILETYEIIDGMHRTSKAVYEKQDTLVCDVFHSPKTIIEITGEAGVMTKDYFTLERFSKDELYLIEQKNREIMHRYGIACDT